MARKKKSSKKKRDRNKPEPPVEAEPEASAPAEAAPAGSPPPALPPHSRPEEPGAIDLDADLDAGVGDDTLDQLIAATLATADDEDPSFDDDGADDDVVTVIDLDDEQPAAPTAPAAASEANTPPSASPPPKDVAAPAALASVVREAARGTQAPSDGPPPVEVSVDLGPVSSPAMRDRLLAEALAHAEHRDARYRVPYDDQAQSRAWKGVVIAVLLLVASGLAVFPPNWVRPTPPAVLTDAERLRGIRTALLLQAQQVDAYRVGSQELPPSLDVLPSRFAGVRYVRTGNRAYQLIAYGPDGRPVIYDSADLLGAYQAIATTWALRGTQP